MKIADRTPFRTESGEIDTKGRIQGTLKYGLAWFGRMQAQDAVIAVMDKVLGGTYVLLRNVTLPDTDIELPMVLIGPPGIYLINVINERGVYRARDDEWGTVSGEKFVPASVNPIERTTKLSRVLQIYIDRAGYKGMVTVEPLMIAADPGMHIESVRPAVRIVMNDALERFAISMNQARAVLSAEAIGSLGQLILSGPRKQAPAPVPVPVPVPSTPEPVPYQPAGQDEPSTPFSADDFSFSFADDDDQQEQPAQGQNAERQNTGFQDSFDEQAPESSDRNSYATDESAAAEPAAKRKPRAPRKAGLFGMTTAQVAILGGILLCWLCSMLAFGVYVYLNG